MKKAMYFVGKQMNFYARVKGLTEQDCKDSLSKMGLENPIRVDLIGYSLAKMGFFKLARKFEV